MESIVKAGCIVPITPNVKARAYAGGKKAMITPLMLLWKKSSTTETKINASGKTILR